MILNKMLSTLALCFLSLSVQAESRVLTVFKDWTINHNKKDYLIKTGTYIGADIGFFPNSKDNRLHILIPGYNNDEYMKVNIKKKYHRESVPFEMIIDGKPYVNESYFEYKTRQKFSYYYYSYEDSPQKFKDFKKNEKFTTGAITQSEQCTRQVIETEGNCSISHELKCTGLSCTVCGGVLSPCKGQWEPVVRCEKIDIPIYGRQTVTFKRTSYDLLSAVVIVDNQSYEPIAILEITQKKTGRQVLSASQCL